MEISSVMFTLLRCEIEGTELCCDLKNLITPEILPALFKISKKHDLAHLVGDVLDRNNLLPEDSEIQERFLQERSMAVYRVEQLNHELEQICRIFEDNELPHIPLKGSVLRGYYPQSWMRTSCDIDILVKKEDLQRAVQVLKDSGFKYKETQSHDVQFWAESGVHIELHFDLIEESVAEKSAETLAHAWERTNPCEGWKYRLEFDNEFFYLYHIAHMAKHFLNGGCGIRPFLDIWILNRKVAFNAKEKEKLLKQAELCTFEQNAKKLSKIWFENEKYDELSVQIENYILNAGVYGSLDNQIALKQVQLGGKRKQFVSRIFLPYSFLKLTYPNLEKYPVLFPFYQVRRWFRIVFGKHNKKAFRELKGIATTTEAKKNDLVALCKNLGLKQD